MKREPFTCLRCWEERNTNVRVEDEILSYDNRSVEVKMRWKCPKCGWTTVGAL